MPGPLYNIFGSLSVDEQFLNFRPNLNQAEAPGWARIGNLRFHYSPCQKLKEKAQVRFKIKEILFHCLDNLKVY